MFNFFRLFEMGSARRKGDHEKQEFSKTLLVQESLLIWIHSIAMLVLAYICVFRGYFAELPWLTAMTSLPWAAYAISQRAYYKNAQAENTKDGIKYDVVMNEYCDFDEEALG